VGTSGAILRTHITHVDNDEDWKNKCIYTMKEGQCVVRLKEMPTAIPKKRPHEDGAGGEVHGEPWAVALFEACDTAACPEDAVFAIKDQYAHIWIDKYAKLMEAAVIFSARPMADCCSRCGSWAGRVKSTMA
jgi:hypothetical protein